MVSVDGEERVSIDVRMSLSVDVGLQESVDGTVIILIDAENFSLRIVHSKSAGSENCSGDFLLLLVLLGMHLKKKRKKFSVFL